MTAAGQTEWISWGFVAFVAFVAFVIWATVVVKTTNRRWEHDLPLLTDDAQWCQDFGHNYRLEHKSALLICQQCGGRQDPCQVYGHDWRRYANYRLCMGCGVRVDDKVAS